MRARTQIAQQNCRQSASEPGSAIIAPVIAVRLALLGVAVAAVAWFALGVRSVHDQNQVTKLVNTHPSLTAAEERYAVTKLAEARTLNPDQGLNALHAQIELNAGHPALAEQIAKALVRSAPRDVDSWVTLAVLTRARAIPPSTGWRSRRCTSSPRPSRRRRERWSRELEPAGARLTGRRSRDRATTIGVHAAVAGRCLLAKAGLGLHRHEDRPPRRSLEVPQLRRLGVDPDDRSRRGPQRAVQRLPLADGPVLLRAALDRARPLGGAATVAGAAAGALGVGPAATARRARSAARAGSSTSSRRRSTCSIRTRSCLSRARRSTCSDTPRCRGCCWSPITASAQPRAVAKLARLVVGGGVRADPHLDRRRGQRGGRRLDAGRPARPRAVRAGHRQRPLAQLVRLSRAGGDPRPARLGVVDRARARARALRHRLPPVHRAAVLDLGHEQHHRVAAADGLLDLLHRRRLRRHPPAVQRRVDDAVQPARRRRIAAVARVCGGRVRARAPAASTRRCSWRSWSSARRSWWPAFPTARRCEPG